MFSGHYRSLEFILRSIGGSVLEGRFGKRIMFSGTIGHLRSFVSRFEFNWWLQTKI